LADRDCERRFPGADEEIDAAALDVAAGVDRVPHAVMLCAVGQNYAVGFGMISFEPSGMTFLSTAALRKANSRHPSAPTP
jgi:hypothetical protein